jgi:branched-chain amino acid aminotransferase/4-amino-4-deoxychorismate lyase
LIPLDDRGLLLGDGLFETVLWSGGALEHFEAHADRLARGCQTLGLPAPDSEHLQTAAVAAVEDAGLRAARAAVRLTWTAGSGGRGLDRPEVPRPRLFASAAPAPEPAGPARLAKAPIRRNEGSPASRLKTLAYLDNVLARRHAREAGADEALILNNAGEIAGAAAANLFWFDGDDLFTPALECGVLDGIMRGVVIDRAGARGLRVLQRALGMPAIARARGAIITNTQIGVRAVSSIDGRPIRSHPALSLLTSPT